MSGIELERRDGIAELVLDRDPGNRFSEALQARFASLVDELREDPDLRVAWIRARGPDFSHGADLGDPALTARMTEGSGERLAIATRGQRMIEGWDALPVPTVASARGRIIGAGACVYLASDFRYASAAASVHFPEVERGMHLSWGILPILAREVGAPTARSLTLACERTEVEGLPPGAVRVEEDPDGAARALVDRLASFPPLAVRSTLGVLRIAQTGVPGAAAGDARAFAETTGSEDFAEAIAAWMERRAGRYRGC